MEESELATVDTDGGTIRYLDSGGSGTPVLFVHGSPGGADQGALLGGFLADAGYRVIAPARPGYQGAPVDDASSTPAQQAARHGALLDALGIERCAVACWSGGGPSSYQLAIDRPELVTSLVAIAAVSTAYEFAGASEEAMLFTRPGAWLMRELGKHAPKAVVKMLATEEGDLPKDKAKELVASIWDDEAKRAWMLAWLETVIGPARKPGFDNDRHQFPDVALDLASITAPVLLVHATTDADVPIAHSEHALEQLPSAELLQIADGTHISAWTGPDEAATQQRIVDFVG